MTDCERIEIEVDGVIVVGEVPVRIPRRINVRLVVPFGILRADVCVPLFGASFADMTSGQGDEVARSLLLGLYRKAVLFDRHRNELAQRWADTEQRLAGLDREDRDATQRLNEQRRRLRARFRAGEIPERSYQLALRELRSRRESFEERRRKVVEEFMSNPPWDKRDGGRGVDLGQVVEFLESTADVTGR
ncbi:MAG: hypothetical protein WA208_18685 [Thermoanaerobaculia bacterium]